MTIECLIKREGATYININGFPYVFVINGSGHYIAEINSTEHQKWLMRCPKDFREYTPEREILYRQFR